MNEAMKANFNMTFDEVATKVRVIGIEQNPDRVNRGENYVKDNEFRDLPHTKVHMPAAKAA